MKRTAIGIGVTLIIVIIVTLAIWWQVFRYHECKKVGHSTFYCILNIDTK